MKGTVFIDHLTGVTILKYHLKRVFTLYTLRFCIAILQAFRLPPRLRNRIAPSIAYSGTVEIGHLACVTALKFHEKWAFTPCILRIFLRFFLNTPCQFTRFLQALILTLCPLTGLSMTLSQAFDSLIHRTHPGHYQSEVRGYMTGGQVSVHLPSTTIRVVDVSPPHIHTGCSGVDLYLGGISYISGDAFLQLLRHIVSNTMGYSFGLSMRTLCPICATVVNHLQRVSQTANQLAIHQCQFAMGLVNTATGEQAVTRTQSTAAMMAAESGQVKDFLSGIQWIGDDMNTAMHAIHHAIEHIENRGQKQQAMQALPFGSSTWKALNGLTHPQKLFIQSLLGTTVRYAYPQAHPLTVTVRPIAASMSVEELANLFIYGGQAIIPNNMGLFVNACQSPHPLCHIVKKIPLQKTAWYQENTGEVHGISLKRYGFFGLSYALLMQALQNIKDKQALSHPQSIILPARIYGPHITVLAPFSMQEIHAFMDLSPLPLYRAINIAATHPDIAFSLINNICEIVAIQYATLFINSQLLHVGGLGNSVAGHAGTTAAQLRHIEMRLSHMRTYLRKKVKMAVDHLSTSQAWRNQVNQLQAQFYSQWLHQGG